MSGIRVNTGAKQIEVNDNGDVIVLNLSDNAFVNRFFSLYENMKKLAEESDEKEKEIREHYKDSSNDDALLRDTLDLYAQAGKKMKEEVDSLFGEGACKKIFGDITPAFELYLDFFEQLTPYLQEFAKEKTQRLNKYSAARTGNV